MNCSPLLDVHCGNGSTKASQTPVSLRSSRQERESRTSILYAPPAADGYDGLRNHRFDFLRRSFFSTTGVPKPVFGSGERNQIFLDQALNLRLMVGNT